MPTAGQLAGQRRRRSESPSLPSVGDLQELSRRPASPPSPLQRPSNCVRRGGPLSGRTTSVTTRAAARTPAVEVCRGEYQRDALREVAYGTCGNDPVRAACLEAPRMGGRSSGSLCVESIFPSSSGLSAHVLCGPGVATYRQSS